MSGIKNRKQYLYEESHKIDDNGEIYKLCSLHNEWYPEETEWILMNNENFYKNKSSPDGYYPYCKKCCIRKSKKWTKDNPEQRKILQDKYNATEDRKLKNREVSKRRRLEGKHKEYQQKNPEKLRIYNQKREKEKLHKISIKEWESCKQYFNHECAYCGMTEKEHKKKYNQQLHKEHVIFNGANDLSNCVPSCKNCNSQKWEFNMQEWYKEQEFYSEEKYNKILQWLSKDHLNFIKERK